MANSLPVTEVEFEQYDVFLCHRGPDTKFGFASYLYERLEGAGLRPFLDYKSIVHGQDSQACMDSALMTTPIALVIFSEKFVDSEWCLNELYELMSIDSSRVKVLLVFYKVKPDQVCFREESNEFKELKRKHGGSIDRWKHALEKARNLCGKEYLGQRPEPELVKAVVQEVSKFANKSLPLDVGNYVFGTKKVVDEIIQKHMGVSILLLWGMGGMGKSTLAGELYNRLKDKTGENSLENLFTASCYVEVSNLKEVKVQTLILKNLCPSGGDWKFASKREGKRILEERLSKKRILVVLDGVPDNGELYFWISRKMLTEGSMCIVTCRNRDVVEKLNEFDMEKDVHLHQVQGLGSEDSQYVFASLAFDGHWNVTTGFEELVAKISVACGGVPLVLEVCGALVKGMDVAFWKEVLEKLIVGGKYDTFGRKIFECLRISFDALPRECQEIFLDISFALLGEPKDMAILVWKSHGWSPTVGIQILVQRALVTVDSFDRFRMHDELRDMGRQIIVEQRSTGVITRLSMPESLEHLRQNEGFPESLELLKIYNVQYSGLSALDISHMKKLRILMCDDTITATSIPKSLCWWKLYERWFHWDNNPRHRPVMTTLPQVMTTLPTVPLPNNKLMILSLPRSHIKMLPDIVVRLEKLEVLDLRECSKLRLLPDSFGRLGKLRQLNLERSGITSLPESFGDLSCLEVLNLRGCSGLEMLLESFGGLTKLRDLNLGLCGITSLPASFGELSSLEVLNVSGCEMLLLLPGSLTGLKNLKEFGYAGSAFESLLLTMGCLKDFEESSLSSKLNTLQNILGIMKTRKELVLKDFAVDALPESFGELGNLEVLILRKYRRLALLPKSFGGLRKLRDLNLEGSGIRSLPESFGVLSNLEVLNLRDCSKLGMLPESFGGLTKLQNLNLGLCRITSLPASFGELSSLEVLNGEGCKKLHLLPDSLVGLRKLRELNLEGSGIRSLPESFGVLSNLEVLDLRECSELRLLPDSFGRLRMLRQVNLERSGIRSLPESFGDLSCLEVLNLRGCSGLEMLPESFGGLTKLRDLNLGLCGITSLPASFGELSSLEVLNLRGCEKLLLLPGSLTGLKNLKEFGYAGSAFESLLLTMGCLKDFEESSLSSKLNTLQNLLGIMKTRKELVLKDFAVDALPESFGELGNLEVLILRKYRRLALLPKSFGGLRKLRDLNLEGSGIRSLPESFGVLSNLEVLNLRDCSKLGMLPESFGGLTKLQNLNLGLCRITSLPASFGELSSLEVLNGEGCKKLHLLPDSLVGLRKLRELNLGLCGITSLPESFGVLSNLEVLDLRGCEKLLLLPGSLTGLKNLKEFGYAGSAFESLLLTMGCLKDFEESSLSSKLNTLQNILGIMKTRKELVLENFAVEALPASFGELGNLEVLNLRRCSGLEMLPESIGGLRKLRDLNLEGSGIRSLPESFGVLSNLEVLNLRDCSKLGMLPESFGGLTKLRDLNSEDTGIRSLPESFSRLSNLEVLNVGNSGKYFCSSPRKFLPLGLTLNDLGKLRELIIDGVSLDVQEMREKTERDRVYWHRCLLM